MKALLVDNEILTRQGVAQLLKKVEPRLEITEATTEEEMRRYLENSSFDIVFLDINLVNDGDGRGLELLKEMKDNDKSPLITPIIMVSNDEDNDTVSLAFKNGASGFLPKLRGNEDMARKAIQRVLDGEVYYPAPLSRSIVPSPPKRHLLKREESGLTPKQFEALFYLIKGLSNKGIAIEMDGISEHVAAEHVTAILKEFKVINRKELMAQFHEKNIVVDFKKI